MGDSDLVVFPDLLSPAKINVLLDVFGKQSFQTSQTEDVVSLKDRNSLSALAPFSFCAKYQYIAQEILAKFGFRELGHVEPQCTHYQHEEGKPQQIFDKHHDEGIFVQNDEGTFIVEPSGDDNPRIVTIIIYLNDTDGGATHFPMLGGSGIKCPGGGVRYGPGEGGVRVQPKAGTVAVFTNMEPGTGLPKRNAVHAGEAVRSGEKKIMQWWVHLKPVDDSASEEDDEDDEDWTPGPSKSKKLRK